MRALMPEPMTPSDGAPGVGPAAGASRALTKASKQWRARRAGFGSAIRMRRRRPGPTASHMQGSELPPASPGLLLTGAALTPGARTSRSRHSQNCAFRKGRGPLIAPANQKLPRESLLGPLGDHTSRRSPQS